MMQPRMWRPGLNDILFCHPCPKRKRDAPGSLRGSAPYNPGRTSSGYIDSYPDTTLDYSRVPYDTPGAGPSSAPSHNPAAASSSAAVLHPPLTEEEVFGNSDPLGGWNVPVSQKRTQGQKRALRVQRRVASGIPPRGYGGGNKPNWFGVVAITPRRNKSKKIYDDSSDYTSVEDDDSSSQQPPLPTGPLEGAQSSETSTLTQPSESPISQVPSLTSNL